MHIHLICILFSLHVFGRRMDATKINEVAKWASFQIKLVSFYIAAIIAIPEITTIIR